MLESRENFACLHCDCSPHIVAHATALSATEAESCSNSGQESGLVNFVSNLFREVQLLVGDAAVKYIGTMRYHSHRNTNSVL